MSSFVIYNYNFLRIIEPNPEYQLEFPGWVNVDVKESFEKRQQLLEELLLADFEKPFQFENARKKLFWHKQIVKPQDNVYVMRVASVLRDPVTTTDELIPSGETSSYRSNPMKLAQFTLSRRDPDYVPRAKAAAALESARAAGGIPAALADTLHALGLDTHSLSRLHIGSVIFANKPGDGSAREQAASCQRVLGGSANICYEFATKRYRSNCVNWGLLPFTLAADDSFDGAPGDFIYVPEVREKVARGDEEFPAVLLHDGRKTDLLLYLKNTNAEERELLLRGCLINYYAAKAVN